MTEPRIAALNRPYPSKIIIAYGNKAYMHLCAVWTHIVNNFIFLSREIEFLSSGRWPLRISEADAPSFLGRLFEFPSSGQNRKVC